MFNYPKLVLMGLAAVALFTGVFGVLALMYKRGPAPASPAVIRGDPMKAPTDSRRTNHEPEPVVARLRPNSVVQTMEEGYLRLPFDNLSSFPYEVYPVVNPAGGRPLLKSDDTIPPDVKAYDGRAVTVRGYVLALRLKQGRVREFLLLRDQGTCCFGEAAQINHYIRVKLEGDGLKPGLEVPVAVSGILRVGEMYEQGYLTGIYSLDATRAVPD